MVGGPGVRRDSIMIAASKLSEEMLESMFIPDHPFRGMQSDFCFWIDTLKRVKTLIVNADDFGLTPGVNRAIVELARQGCVTSATLMARASATDEAIALAMHTPELGVGCHIVLVDGQSSLPVEARPLPWLIDPATGEFWPTLGRFLRALYASGAARSARDEAIEAEAFAQIRGLQSSGLRLTHIDTHKHTHMFPAVLRPVLRAARRAGVRRVRNPFEPEWSARATPGAAWLRRAQVRVLRQFRAAFYRIVAEEGFVTTAGSIGVLATGTLDRSTVAALLGALPNDVWELVTHPGYHDSALAEVRTRLLASREVEIDALGLVATLSSIERIRFDALINTENSRR
uniref:YdjC-like protein n=1 Tax=mine drainage metagenome TaxID=410659 RepID=E6PZ59_9ZZZZ